MTELNFFSKNQSELNKTSLDYYLNEDVVYLSRNILGKVLCTNIDGVFCSGIITETEAYAGIGDKGSHAFANKKTKRTSTMYEAGGIAYIYLCYGIHSMFNVVCGNENSPKAILIRALYPLFGIDIMMSRVSDKTIMKSKIMNGPGKLCKAMGLHYSMDGISLRSNEVFITDLGISPSSNKIISGPRIGIDYAGKDALLPYRFYFNYEA